jgi:hypothetical protein
VQKTVVGHWSLAVSPKLDAAATASEYRQNLDETEDKFRIAARNWAARNKKGDRRLCADEKPK